VRADNTGGKRYEQVHSALHPQETSCSLRKD